MVTVGKKINALGSGILTLLFIYSIFMTVDILVYNFMIFPLVIIIIFFGFDSD